MDWLEFGKTFGVPLLILAALGLFVWKSIWPFVVSQVESARDDRIKEREAFLTALERRDTLTQTTSGEQTKALQELTRTLIDFRDEWRRERKP